MREVGILKEEYHSPFPQVAGKPVAHKGGTEKPGKWELVLLIVSTSMSFRNTTHSGNGPLSAL